MREGDVRRWPEEKMEERDEAERREEKKKRRERERGELKWVRGWAVLVCLSWADSPPSSRKRRIRLGHACITLSVPV